MDHYFARVAGSKFLVLAATVLCCFLWAPSGSVADDLAARAAGPEAHASLLSKVDSEGAVRVIVRVNNAFAPEPTLTEKGIQEQRSAIALAQEALLASLFVRGKVPHSFYQYQYTPYVAMTVDKDVLEALAASPSVVRIEEDLALPPSAVNYSLGLIGATTLHSQGKTGKGYVVAVLDTGVDKSHPYLVGSVVSEACYSTNDATTR